MLSDEWLQRYRLLENFTAKWNGNGNGNAYDRGDYNSSFALRAVELKTDKILHCNSKTLLVFLKVKYWNIKDFWYFEEKNYCTASVNQFWYFEGQYNFEG